MKINISNSFFLLFINSLLLFSCSQKNNNIDLSNLPVPIQKEIVDTNKDNKDYVDPNNKDFIKELVPFKNKEKLLSQFKFGKSDPFSKSEDQVTKLSSDFKLTGFLNTKFRKYVFVNYLGNEGAISENSVGGLNTNLLPEGAKVITIDSKAMKLTINHDNENFVFEL